MKVLILTRSFPPANRAASYRALSWAKYFKENGTSPTIITRNWDSDLEIKDNRGNVLSCGTKVERVVEDTHDVYYVPYKNLRSLRLKNAGGLRRFLGRIMLLFEHVRPYSLFFNDESGIYRFALKHIKENPGVYDKILVTAPPYIYLKLGSKIHKKTGVKWVADYRDEWNSRGGLFKNPVTTNKVLKLLDGFRYDPLRLEKRWLTTADFITVNTKQGISNLKELFHGKSIWNIPNGFLEDEFQPFRGENFEQLTLLYSGTLYWSQKVEVLLDACKAILNEGPSWKMRLVFVGLNRKNAQVERIRKHLGEHAHIFEPTDVVSKQKALEYAQRAHVLLMFAHGDNDSVAPSKLYEYIALEKPVLLAPSDGGVMEETLSSTRQVSACISVDETKRSILGWLEELRTTGNVKFEIDPNLKAGHNRRLHARKLAQLLKDSMR